MSNRKPGSLRSFVFFLILSTILVGCNSGGSDDPIDPIDPEGPVNPAIQNDEVQDLPVLLSIQRSTEDESIVDFTSNPEGTEVAVLFNDFENDISRLTIYDVPGGNIIREITDGRDLTGLPGGRLFWANNNLLTMNMRATLFSQSEIWLTWNTATGQLQQSSEDSGICSFPTRIARAKFDPVNNRVFLKYSDDNGGGTAIAGGMCRIDLATHSFDNFEFAQLSPMSDLTPLEFDVTPGGETMYATFRSRPDDITNFDPAVNFNTTHVYDTETFQLIQTVSTDQFDDPRLNEIRLAGTNYSLFRDNSNYRILPDNRVLEIQSDDDYVSSSDGSIVAIRRDPDLIGRDQVISLPDGTVAGNFSEEGRSYEFISAFISANGKRGFFLRPGNPATLDVLDLTARTSVSAFR